MMGIVINQDDILHRSIRLKQSFKFDLETPSNSAKVFQYTNNYVVMYADATRSNQGCQGILNIVYSR